MIFSCEGKNITSECELKLRGSNYYFLDIWHNANKIGEITASKVNIIDERYTLKKSIHGIIIKYKLTRQEKINKIRDYLLNKNIELNYFFNNLERYSKNSNITKECQFKIEKSVDNFYNVVIYYNLENIGVINKNGFNLNKCTVEKYDNNEFEISDKLDEKIISGIIIKENIKLEELL